MKKPFLFLLAFLLIIAFSMEASASSLSPWEPNSSTGWKYSTIAGHMGTKTSTYKYSSSAVKTKYETYINEGIKLWGSNISMTYSSTSILGTITESLDASISTTS